VVFLLANEEDKVRIFIIRAMDRSPDGHSIEKLW